MVVVSHDRWFLDRICTHILSFEGDSNVVFYEGTYSEYEEYKRKQAYFYGFTHFECTFVDAFHAHDHLEQCCFTGTVRTDHTHDAVRRKHEVQVVEQ